MTYHDVTLLKGKLGGKRSGTLRQQDGGLLRKLTNQIRKYVIVRTLSHSEKEQRKKTKGKENVSLPHPFASREGTTFHIPAQSHEWAAGGIS